jgi:KRAB domain-containing zinc finger protein
MAGKPNAKCDTCDYSTTKRGDLNHHTNVVHLKVKNYKCTQCSYKSGKKSNIKMHIKTVHIKKDEISSVITVTKHLGDKRQLTKHIGVIHKKIKRFWCDVCDYSSYTRAKIEIHSNTVHLEKKYFKCDHCDKTFSQKGHLGNHINRIYKKIKSYSCGLCNYTSCTKSELKGHSIRIHSNGLYCSVPLFSCLKMSHLDIGSL